MQGRSWMAALTIAAGLAPVWVPRAGAGDPVVSPGTATGAAAKAGSEGTSVKLELRIAGLTAKGCDVEVKPGHAGCQFDPLTRHVERQGELVLLIRDPKARNADRDCTFAITIREPGQPERTVRRGLRLARNPGAPQTLSFYLSSPSKLARAEEKPTAKR